MALQHSAKSARTKIQRLMLHGGAKSSLGLSPHDLSVISVVARKPNVDRDTLIDLVEKSRVSKNAFDIVKLMLYPHAGAGGKRVGKEAYKEAVARNYLAWGSAINASTASVTATSGKSVHLAVQKKKAK